MFARLGQLIATPAAMVVLVAFLMPWITVSCATTEADYNGADIASGNLKPSELALLVDLLGETPDGNDIIYAVPTVALIGLGLALLSARRRGLASAIGVLMAVAGAVGLRVMVGLQQALQAGLETARTNGDFLGLIRIRYELGWWLTVGGLVGMVLGGLLAAFAPQRRKRHH